MASKHGKEAAANGVANGAVVTPKPLLKKSSLVSATDLRFLFHACCLLAYLRVWLWHLSPAAQALPGATGFGWFFRYLTFYSFTLQLGQLFLCCLSDIAKDDGSKLKVVLDSWSDDLSCALFGLANVVTVMYYAIDAASGREALVEGGKVARPIWLGFSVHVFNSIAAWGDLLVSHPRSFGQRSQRLSLGLVTTYTAWILVCSRFNGAFPYPFLNDLPFPQGFIAVVAAALLIFFIVFRLGRRLSAPLLNYKMLSHAKAL